MNHLSWPYLYFHRHGKEHFPEQWLIILTYSEDLFHTILWNNLGKAPSFLTPINAYYFVSIGKRGSAVLVQLATPK